MQRLSTKREAGKRKPLQMHSMSTVDRTNVSVQQTVLTTVNIEGDPRLSQFAKIYETGMWSLKILSETEVGVMTSQLSTLYYT